MIGSTQDSFLQGLPENVKKTIEQVAKEETHRILAHLSPDELLELEKQELTQEELENRANNAELFYKSHFEKVIKLFTFRELLEMGKEAETKDQVLFYRGVIYGLQFINDWFEDQVKISLAKFDKEETPTEGPIPPLGRI